MYISFFAEATDVQFANNTISVYFTFQFDWKIY